LKRRFFIKKGAQDKLMNQSLPCSSFQTIEVLGTTDFERNVVIIADPSLASLLVVPEAEREDWVGT